MKRSKKEEILLSCPRHSSKNNVTSWLFNTKCELVEKALTHILRVK